MSEHGAADTVQRHASINEAYLVHHIPFPCSPMPHFISRFDGNAARLVVGIILMSIQAPVLGAQRAHVTFDGVAGLGRGLGASDEVHSGIFVGARVTTTVGRTGVLSLGMSRDGLGPTGDDCRRPTPESTCQPPLRFNTVSLSAGRQFAPDGHTVRLSAGPALVYGAADVTALGVVAQSDIALLRTGNMALVGSLAGTWLPNYRVRAYGALAGQRNYGALQAGIGIRVF